MAIQVKCGTEKIDLQKIISSFYADSGRVYRYLYFYGKAAKNNVASEQLLSAFFARAPRASAQCLTGASYFEAFIRSVKSGTLPKYTAALCTCVLFLLNGIEAVAGKEASMQHLYCILDKRLESSLPFVIFGESSPADIRGLAPRICTILDGILVWQLA